jgi:hypothetical protein
MLMASEQQVRQYLAYWFQLGKGIVVHNGQETLLPRPVIQGNRYSDEFEACWQRVSAVCAGDCYLEGTEQTIAKLLTPEWEISPCARCSMPVPLKTLGIASLDCTCSDLANWPDKEMPVPRSPVDTQAQLQKIRDRLKMQAPKT